MAYPTSSLGGGYGPPGSAPIGGGGGNYGSNGPSHGGHGPSSYGGYGSPPPGGGSGYGDYSRGPPPGGSGHGDYGSRGAPPGGPGHDYGNRGVGHGDYGSRGAPSSGYGHSDSGGRGGGGAGYPDCSKYRNAVLTLSPCQHREISAIVSGRYVFHSENHGKPVFKKDAPSREGLYPLVYYWDSRDGEKFAGWWLGPKVGGDQVWGYHHEASQTPPERGWRVPFDGQIDNGFVCMMTGGAGDHSRGGTSDNRNAPIGGPVENRRSDDRGRERDRDGRDRDGPRDGGGYRDGGSRDLGKGQDHRGHRDGAKGQDFRRVDDYSSRDSGKGKDSRRSDDRGDRHGGHRDDGKGSDLRRGDDLGNRDGGKGKDFRRGEGDDRRRHSPERGRVDDRRDQRSDYDRRQQEDKERERKREEDRRREEERRRQDDQRRHQAEEARKRDEWARKAREDDKRREEERKRADEQRKREDERRRRDQQDRNKKEEEARARAAAQQTVVEERAAQQVRQAIQKLNMCIAHPGNFDAAVIELRSHLTTELGSKFDQVEAEVNQGIQSTQERIAQKANDEKEAVEKEKKLQCKLEELADVIDVADAKNDLLKEVVDPLTEPKNVFEQGELAMAVAGIDECVTDSASGQKACLEFLSETSTIDISEGFRTAETRSVLTGLLKRMGESGVKLQEHVKGARNALDGKIQQVAAKQFIDQRKVNFDKYDEDGDGFWNRLELAAYAKREFSFEASSEVLDRIVHACTPDGNAIKFESFHLANSVLGVAREMDVLRQERAEQQKREAEAALEREKKEAEAAAEREKRQAVLEPARKELNEKLLAIASLAEKSEAAVLEAERAFTPIQSQAKVSKMDTDTVRNYAEDCDKSVASCTAMIAEALGQVKTLEPEEVFPELKDYREEKLKRLRGPLAVLETRTKKVVQAILSTRTLASKRDSIEMNKLRVQIVAALRTYMQQEKLNKEALFAKAAEAGKTGLTEEQWLSLAVLCDIKELTSEQLSRFFRMSQQGNDLLEAEVLYQLLAVTYKVMKETVITSELDASLKDSKVVRKVQIGEVLEALEGPQLEETVGLMRVRAKATKDNAEGWVSISSTSGTLYLEEVAKGSNLDTYKVVKEVPVTDGLNSDEVVRELKVGEVFEKLEFPKNSEKSELRIRGRTKDQVVGWATISAEGQVFLQL